MNFELSEKQIQDQILNYLKLNNIFHWRQNTGAAQFDRTDKYGIKRKSFVKFGEPGISDIICLHKGLFIAIEVKAKRGRLSANQIKFLRSIQENGGVPLVARSLDNVIDFFNEVNI